MHPSRSRAFHSSAPHLFYQPVKFALGPLWHGGDQWKESCPLRSDFEYADVRWPIYGGYWKRAKRPRCRRLQCVSVCVSVCECVFIAPVRLRDLYSLWNSDKEKKIWYNLPQRHVSVFLCGSTQHIWVPSCLSVRLMSNLSAVGKNMAKRDEGVSVSGYHLFIVLHIPTALCSLSWRWTQIQYRPLNHIHVTTGRRHALKNSEGAEISAKCAQKDMCDPAELAPVTLRPPPSSGVSCNESKQCGRPDSTYYTTSP